MEGVGSFSSNKISEEELIAIEKTALPGPGSCGGMYTANTMASAIEALGMSLPGSSSQDAVRQINKKTARKLVMRSTIFLKKISSPQTS